MATRLATGIRPAELSPGRRWIEDHLDDTSPHSLVQQSSARSTGLLKRKRDPALDLSPGRCVRSNLPHDQTHDARLPPSPCHTQTNAAGGGNTRQTDPFLVKTHRKSSLSSASSGQPWQSRRTTPESSLATPADSPCDMPPNKPSQFQGTHIGASVDLEPLLLDLAPGHSTHTGEIYQNFGGTPFLLRPNDQQQQHAPHSENSHQLERLVGHFGSELIEAYFTNVHYNFPIVGADFFQLYRAGRRERLSDVLVAAIYIVAAPWLPGSVVESFAASVDVQALEQLAFSSLSRSLSSPNLATIQAGLLLIQRPNVDSKTLNSQLVAAAYELGLHIDCSSWEVEASEIGLRKRLAWALYVQDKWCSLIHGRPSAISTNNWVVKSLTEQDFDEMLLGSRPCDASGSILYMQMASLTEILSSVLDTFYTLKSIEEVNAAAENGTRLVLERAKPTQLRLKEWFSALPAALKMDASADERPTSIGYLHLAYFATEITLHRCIIRSLHNSGGEPYLMHICRSAAKTRLISAMDFVNRLRREHLEAFWYFPSRNSFALIGTFGSLLLATSPGQEEADFYGIRLSEYRWTLSVSSKSAPFLLSAIESLDNTDKLLQNLPPKPRTSEMVEASEGSFQTEFWSSLAARSAEVAEEDDEDDDEDDDE